VIDLDGYGIALLLGMLNTLKLSVYALAIGLVLGMAGAVSKMSGFRPLRVAADGVTTLVRGIPELLFVLAVYLGSSVVINNAAAWMGYEDYIEIDAFCAGIIALSVVFGAYATEVFRGAIQAVAQGQVEAARAFGMTRPMVFRRVVLPQMWRMALPGIGNLYMVLLKNTALLSVIGVQELMRNTVSAVGFTKKPFLFYLAASFLYLFLTSVNMAGIDWLESRAERGVKRGV